MLRTLFTNFLYSTDLTTLNLTTLRLTSYIGKNNKLNSFLNFNINTRNYHIPLWIKKALLRSFTNDPVTPN